MNPTSSHVPHLRPGRRSGVSLKGCLVVVAGIILLVIAAIGAIYFWVNSKVAAQTSTPITLAPVPEAEKVRVALDVKCKETAFVVVGGKEGTMTLTSDEFYLLIRQLVPDEFKDSMRVTLADGLALIQLPIKGAQAARFVPASFGTIRWYLANKVSYLNLEAKAQIGYDDGRWTVDVREVTRPMAFSPGQLQGLVNEIKKKAPPSVRLPLGKDEASLVSLEIKGSNAIARFAR